MQETSVHAELIRKRLLVSEPVNADSSSAKLTSKREKSLKNMNSESNKNFEQHHLTLSTAILIIGAIGNRFGHKLSNLEKLENSHFASDSLKITWFFPK